MPAPAPGAVVEVDDDDDGRVDCEEKPLVWKARGLEAVTSGGGRGAAKLAPAAGVTTEVIGLGTDVFSADDDGTDDDAGVGAAVDKEDSNEEEEEAEESATDEGWRGVGSPFIVASELALSMSPLPLSDLVSAAEAREKDSIVLPLNNRRTENGW